MENTRIPILNQKFEIRTFLTIFRKLFWIMVTIVFLSIVVGLLFYRYTKPVFTSSSVLQIKFENKSNQIFGLGSGLIDQELAPAIELLRSNEFLKSCINELQVDVSYFNQGTFLSSELYENPPFEVKYRINNQLILDTKIFIEFEANNCNLDYEIGGNQFRYTISLNQWHSLNGIDIYVNPTDLEGDDSNNGKNDYYFIINNPNTILKTISSNLEVQTLSESAGTILITYSDYNAKKAADITNTIAEKFIRFDEERKKESALNIVNYIDQQMDIVLEQLNESERALHEFRRNNNIKTSDNSFLQNRTNLLTNTMGEMETQIFMVEIEIMTLNKITEMLEGESEVPNIYEMLALITGHQSERFLTSMLNSVLNLEQQKTALLFDVTSNNYKIKKIDTQIEMQKGVIIDFILSTIIRLENQQSEFRKRINELENRMFKDSVYDEIEYAKLLRLQTIHEGFYSQLIKTKAETMISQAGYVSDNLILEKAVEAESPEYPNLTRSLIVSVFIAIILSMLILVIRYLFYNRVNSTQEINEYSKIPVLGGVPSLKAEMNTSKIVLFDRPKSMISEAFRNIRTNLEFFEKKDDNCRVISVSSTIAGEGKTFVALNIGAIFAMAGKKVILLDFDLRKPRFHKAFEVPNDTGISNILIGKSKFEDCLNKSEFENIDFITSGPLPPNPAEIVITGAFEKLINELKSHYDIVIIDTPPLGIVTDALPSFKIADNPIYIMRSGISPKSFIEHVNSLKETNHFDKISIILNGIVRSNIRLGYGYKTGYGYQYGYSGYGYGYGYLTKIHNSYYGEEFEEKKGIRGFIIRLLKKRNL
jgi:tyrosine-protein kinase Etk/Wzc